MADSQMIRVQSSRPYVEVDGCKRYVEAKTAKFLEMLLLAKGNSLPKERLVTAMQIAPRTLGHYSTCARRAIEGSHCKIIHEPLCGYSIVWTKPVEFAVMQPK